MFKAGDIVECIDSTGMYPFLLKRGLYKIDKVRNDSVWIGGRIFNEDRFEKADKDMSEPKYSTIKAITRREITTGNLKTYHCPRIKVHKYNNGCLSLSFGSSESVSHWGPKALRELSDRFIEMAEVMEENNNI